MIWHPWPILRNVEKCMNTKKKDKQRRAKSETKFGIDFYLFYAYQFVESFSFHGSSVQGKRCM